MYPRRKTPRKGFASAFPLKIYLGITEKEKRRKEKMSFSNPQNDINPEPANGCGSLAFEDIWLSLPYTASTGEMGNS